MKKRTKRTGQTIFLGLGIAFLAVGTLLLIWWQWEMASSLRKSESYVQTMYQLLPEIQGSVPEERRDNTMSALSIDGTDFLGIFNIPRYGAEVPVSAEWGMVWKYPCCFDGSIYDGTMQIGATSQKGQFDFYKEISVGDTATFTDMEGNRYPYIVKDIRYASHVDPEVLQKEGAELTLFIKNIYGLDYVVVYFEVLRG